MLNKIKMGQFIKENRIKYFKTQEKLMYALNENMVSTSIAAIGMWEKGKTVPDTDKILVLAKLFNLTVDEILNGQKIEHLNFNEKYFIANPTWYLNQDPDVNTYEMKQKNIILINKNYEQLFKKFIYGNISVNETKEFEFLINNFYILHEDLFDVETNLVSNFFKLKKMLNKDKFTFEMSGKERFRYFYRMFIPNNLIRLGFVETCNAILENDELVLQRFNALDSNYKDLTFNMIQKIDPLTCYSQDANKTMVKVYEKRLNQKYVPQQLIAKIIKYFINHGANINYCYLNKLDFEENNIRNIDVLEKAYRKIGGALKIKYVNKNKEVKYFKVDNNPMNFMLINCYSILNADLDYDPKELFKLVAHNEEPTEEYVARLMKLYNIDENQEEQYKKAELNYHCGYRFEIWKKIYHEYEIYDKQRSLIFATNKDLEMGLDYSMDVKEVEIGGNTEEEMYKTHSWSSILSDKYIDKQRDKELTKQLLDEVDNLSLKDIRKKYFPFKYAMEEEQYVE